MLQCTMFVNFNFDKAVAIEDINSPGSCFCHHIRPKETERFHTDVQVFLRNIFHPLDSSGCQTLAENLCPQTKHVSPEIVLWI